MDDIETILADANRTVTSDQVLPLEQLGMFITKMYNANASLKADLKNPVKQLETILANKDAEIASLREIGMSSLPIVETLNLTSERKAKRSRTNKYAVVECCDARAKPDVSPSQREKNAVFNGAHKQAQAAESTAGEQDQAL